jgi:hypothetical protein
VRRWFFEGLEKGVPCALREHVNFVDDEDLVSVARWAIRQAVLEFTNLVDAVVARAVDFSDIDVRACRDFTASGALQARGCRWARIRGPFRSSGTETVQGAGE